MTLPNKNKYTSGNVLDMVGRGLDSFDHTSKYTMLFVHPEVKELAAGPHLSIQSTEQGFAQDFSKEGETI